jgi:hypothetical protein
MRHCQNIAYYSQRANTTTHKVLQIKADPILTYPCTTGLILRIDHTERNSPAAHNVTYKTYVIFFYYQVYLLDFGPRFNEVSGL